MAHPQGPPPLPPDDSATTTADPLRPLLDAALAHADIGATLAGVLDSIRAHLCADTAVLLLAEGPGAALHVAAAAGPFAEVLAPGLRIALDAAAASAIVSDRRAPALDALVPASGAALRGRAPSRASAALVVDSRLIGILYAGSVQGRAFTAEQEERLQTISDRIALAFDHARLYRAERAARGEAVRAERRFRDLVLNLDAIVWEADMRGAAGGGRGAREGGSAEGERWRYSFVSRRAEKLLGYPVEHWLSTPDFWLEMVPAAERGEVARRRRECLEKGRGGSIEHRVRAADGRILWVTVLFEVVRDEAGVPRQMRGLMLDITQRRQAELDARRLASIVDGSEDAIIAKDLDGKVQSWNFGAERMYGYTAAEAMGRHISFLTPPGGAAELDDIMRKLARGERISHLETRLRRKDGEIVDVALTIAPIRDATRKKIVGASTIAREIGDLKRAERTLRATEKLAATGRLAASIAHEINNPMASVTNLLYLLQHHATLDPTAAEYVKMAQEELQRVTHIVRQMLGFYRESETPVPVNLKDVIDNVLLLYQRRLQNSRIQVRSDFRRSFGDASIRGFPGEIRQVFSNLVVNAIEALGDPEASGGQIRIDVRHARDWSNPSVEGVRVVIGDDGPGIPEAARRHIFEPFFTTKGERGTGLGLWVSEGIVRKHGGVMRVRSSTSARRHGTCFSVFFPADRVALDRAA